MLSGNTHFLKIGYSLPLGKRGLRISSYGFSKKEHFLLKNCLSQNFAIRTSIIQDKKGYQLLFPVDSAAQLYKITKPYVVPCMSYKFALLTP